MTLPTEYEDSNSLVMKQAADMGHTPGPWFVGGVRQKLDLQEALGIFRYDETKKRDENIASVWYDPRNGAGSIDARLIAAAPDLLEALRYIAKTWPDSSAAKTARAAITKAGAK